MLAVARDRVRKAPVPRFDHVTGQPAGDIARRRLDGLLTAGSGASYDPRGGKRGGKKSSGALQDAASREHARILPQIALEAAKESS